MANQEVTTHKQRKILNRIIGDIPIYNWAAKKELSALKRDFHIKRAKKKEEKTQPCTEGH